ncbi:MAG: hypothetical protein GY811_00095 [Myxococcales bacterium]|nr:hypothetical protein [Myxococcales bacterium]
MAVARKNSAVLGRWSTRIGAALVAPVLALRISDSPAGRGCSSSDITLLLLLAVVALKTELFATAGWMLRDGDYSEALTVLMVGSRELLIMPIILLLGGSVLLSLLAGRRRSLARDFDLVCVALTPLVVVELVHALIALAGVDVHFASVIVGYTWSAALLLLALGQARQRPLEATKAASV